MTCPQLLGHPSSSFWPSFRVLGHPDLPTCEKCIYKACPYWDCLDRITVDEMTLRVGQMAKGPEIIQVIHV
jgi:hypothetical protein